MSIKYPNTTLSGLEIGPAGSGADIPQGAGGLYLGRLTTAKRNDLVLKDGLIIYNTTTATYQGCIAGVWIDIAPALAPSVTTIEMNALPTNNGLIVYNTDLLCPVIYTNGAWCPQLTKMTTTQINALVNPIKGMMVYDSNTNTFKVFAGADGGAWTTVTTA